MNRLTAIFFSRNVVYVWNVTCGKVKNFADTLYLAQESVHFSPRSSYIKCQHFGFGYVLKRESLNALKSVRKLLFGCKLIYIQKIYQIYTNRHALSYDAVNDQILHNKHQ